MIGAMNPVPDSVREVRCDVRTQNNIPQSPTTRRRWKQLGIYNPPGYNYSEQQLLDRQLFEFDLKGFEDEA